jgi:Carboxypeptidase regulatory-like domain
MFSVSRSNHPSVSGRDVRRIGEDPMRNRSLFAAIVSLPALLLITALSPRGQTPPQSSQPQQPPPTGLIAGQIVDADTGRPVSVATVILTGRPAAARGGPVEATNDRVRVSSSGWFVFAGLPAGSYTLLVQAPGYVTSRYGQRSLSGPSAPINLGDRQVLTDATIKLWQVATISGTVVDEAGEPAVEATVRALRVTTRGGRRQITPVNTARTDDRGMYRLDRMTPGDYLIVVPHTMVNVPASLVAAFLTARANGTYSNFGRELSASGAPTPFALGQAIGDQMVVTSSLGGPSTEMLAGSNSDLILTYPTTFYPGATTPAEAQRVTVTSGQDRAGIDLRLQPVRTAVVSGTVTGPDGPVANMGVHLIPVGDADFSNATGFDAATTATDGSGAFTFLGVPSGQYTATVSNIPRPAFQTTSVMISTGGGTVVMGMGMSASPGPPPTPTEPTLWGEAPVSVGDTAVSGVAISLRTGARLCGRVAFEGSGAPPTGRALDGIAVTASPADGHATPFMTAGRANADGQFTTMGYPPGWYFIQVTNVGAQGWTLQSVTLGGRNVDGEAITLGHEDLDGIVVTFTQQPNEVNGTVHSTMGSAADDATVFLFPSDYAGWISAGMSPRRLHSTPASGGRFSVKGIPPGQYAIAAVASDEVSDQQDVKFFEALARIGTRLTVDATGTRTLDLTVGHIR